MDGQDESEGPTLRNGSQSWRSERQQSSDYDQLPETITAGERTRAVSRHMKGRRDRDITAEQVKHVLENWVIRGIRTDRYGRQSRAYFASVPGLREMVRVAVSMDDRRVITAFPDRTATTHWNRGELDYFIRNYRNLEQRNAS